jgi:hypothetical protein
MYSRFLFVGLGGSGGKTLRFLKKGLLQWQQQHGIDNPLPRGWQFLNIDTPKVSDGQDIDELVDPLPPDEYLGLINKNMRFSAVQGNLDVKSDLHEEMATWRVDPVGVSVPLVMGAGQFRAIGQTVATSYALRIQQKLHGHLARMQDAAVEPELGRLYQQVTGMQPDRQSGIYVVVVSSLAGGTGAGLLNLVCDILRADGTAGDHIFGLLYTPDVFAALGGPTTGGVQPNSLAAISELMNGHWRQNSPPSPTPVLAQAGVGRLISGSGPSFPFLVGRRNTAGIDFGTHDRTFEMTGRSLVSWVTASASQSGLVPHTIGNWEMQARTHRVGPILVDEGGDDRGFPQFSALGFARVSVGAGYFEEYAKLLVARDANEHLAGYHSHSDEAVRVAKSLASTEPELISRTIAQEQRDVFLRRAGLSEFGPDENQIIEELRPGASLEDDLLDRARYLSTVGDGPKQPIEYWRAEIQDAVNQAQKEYVRKYQSELEDTVSDWADRIQAQLLDAVEEQVSIRGLHVARSLCELAAAHLKDEVAEDLRHEAAKYRKWHEGWQRECRTTLESLSGSVDPANQTLEEALRDAVHLAKFVGDEQLAERAAELCPEVADRLLAPLAEALSDAHATVATDRAQVDSWPTWDAPAPKYAAPPPEELTLISADDYANHFSDLLKQSFPDKAPQERRSMVRHTVIDGGFLKSESGISDDAYNELRCLSVQQNWWPTARWLDPLRTASRLEVDAQAGTDDLKRRASRWLHRQGTPFAKFLDLNLRSYLGSDALYKDAMTAKQVEANTSRFITQLKGAIQASAPLLNIDNELLGNVHPDSPSESHTLYFSQIPLQGHPVEAKVRQELEAKDIEEKKINDILGNDASLTHIDISSTLHSPHSALVMESLVRPIAAAWNRAKGSPAARHAFWYARRGQPMHKFVPVPQSMLLCMIRGWFTGVLLGHIDRGDGAGPPRISQSGARDAAEFPYPFLTPDSDKLARLGQVLEALPLAYAEVGHTADLTPLDPYIALRDLGKSASGTDLSDYRELNSALQAWISDGDHGKAVGEPDRLITSIDKGLSSDAGRDRSHQRAVELAGRLQEIREAYQKRYEKAQQAWTEDPNEMSKASLWTGLWRPISEALRQLSTACGDAARRLDSEADVII